MSQDTRTEQVNENAIQFAPGAIFLKHAFSNAEGMKQAFFAGQEEEIPSEVDYTTDLTWHKEREGIYEVAVCVKLNMHVTHEAQRFVLYNLEATYAGLFHIQHGNHEEALKMMLFAEAPRCLYYPMRHFLNFCTQEIGMPAITIDPFNFSDRMKETIDLQ